MQHNHSYTDEETTLVEHSMRLDPQKMQGVKTKLDYFKVLDDDADLSWSALTILLTGSVHFCNEVKKILSNLDEDIYKKFRQEIVNKIEKNDVLLTSWIGIVLGFENLENDDDAIFDDQQFLQSPHENKNK